MSECESVELRKESNLVPLVQKAGGNLVPLVQKVFAVCCAGTSEEEQNAIPPRSHLRALTPFSIQLTRRNTLQMQFEKFSSFSDISSAVSSDSSEVQLCGSSPLPPTSHNLSLSSTHTAFSVGDRLPKSST